MTNLHDLLEAISRGEIAPMALDELNPDLLPEPLREKLLYVRRYRRNLDDLRERRQPHSTVSGAPRDF
ncbi:hypothetical protein HNR42_003360 [Deinobacterium chartae]|uniref:Uncharacterized protein n=2 Tax=Deinobacterium chartae TaxID=521158 RepID=A0A841I647_9DEIO|nr:hypothetical protein [Deinobacterium chartae]